MPFYRGACLYIMLPDCKKQTGVLADLYSFVQQIFIEHLSQARGCARKWGQRSTIDLVSALVGIYVLVGMETWVLQLWQAWHLPPPEPIGGLLHCLGSSRWGRNQSRLPGS